MGIALSTGQFDSGGLPREDGLVWVLEDSALEAEMARRALATDNRVELFGDGSVVLERVANGQLPDVLVLDWQLPGMSGFEVCRFLRSQHDAMTLPILMLTSFGRKQDLVEALDAGANDYVTKPFDVAELSARVATLGRTSRLQKAQLRRARQWALAAEVGTALTRASSFAEIATSSVKALLAHSDLDSVLLYAFRGDIYELGASAGHLAPLSPETLDRARSSSEPFHVREMTTADVETCVYSLFVAAEAVGALVVSGKRKQGFDLQQSLAPVIDLLSLGIARLRAEEARERSLEAERAARSDAEQANHSKDEFLAMVSHELRTPLNSITGWTSLLLNGSVEPSRTMRALQTIERNARAQAQLIEDLLDISRVMSSTLVLEKVAVDLASAIELARESTAPLAAANEVRIDVVVDREIGAVSGDPRRVQQIIWNLLSNAVKFSPKGGLVTVEGYRVDGSMRVTVADEGQGIAPEFLPFVFERFRQADSSSVRAKGGLGLGLAIVRHLVELHGGTVTASSEGIGRGARFTVELPIGDARRSSPDLRPTLHRPDVTSLQGLELLVVEDDEDSRLLLTALLERSGASVRATSNAAEGLDILLSCRPHVLISDVAMPGEDGITFIRRVRALSEAEGGRTPAIALSAFARSADRARALDAGFQGYFTKPVQPGELVEALQEILLR